jgi:hypothetical protein
MMGVEDSGAWEVLCERHIRGRVIEPSINNRVWREVVWDRPAFHEG